LNQGQKSVPGLVVFEKDLVGALTGYPAYLFDPGNVRDFRSRPEGKDSK
jgi:hypothetical protein